VPEGSDAATYNNAVGPLNIPVTIDPTGEQLYDATPWTGNARPGKCVLSPDMVLLECYAGEDDTQGFDAIKAHAGI
jgi:hypothetical protein